jgi:hypothetical protein
MRKKRPQTNRKAGETISENPISEVDVFDIMNSEPISLAKDKSNLDALTEELLGTYSTKLPEVKSINLNENNKITESIKQLTNKETEKVKEDLLFDEAFDDLNLFKAKNSSSKFLIIFKKNFVLNQLRVFKISFMRKNK